jgi:hypothetical protein
MYKQERHRVSPPSESPVLLPLEGRGVKGVILLGIPLDQYGMKIVWQAVTGRCLGAKAGRGGGIGRKLHTAVQGTI